MIGISSSGMEFIVCPMTSLKNKRTNKAKHNTVKTNLQEFRKEAEMKLMVDYPYKAAPRVRNALSVFSKTVTLALSDSI